MSFQKIFCQISFYLYFCNAVPVAPLPDLVLVMSPGFFYDSVLFFAYFIVMLKVSLAAEVSHTMPLACQWKNQGIEDLFTNTKVCENIPKNLVGGDFADDGAEVVEGLAEVFGEEVGGLAGEEGSLDVLEGFGGAHQGLVVAEIGDDCLVRIQSCGFLGVGKNPLQVIEAEAGFCGNIEFNYLFIRI